MKKLFMSLVVFALLLTGFAHAATLTSVTIGQTVQKDDTLFVFFHAADEQGHAVNGLTCDGIFLAIGPQEKKVQVATVADAGLGVGYVFAVDISKSLSEVQFASVRSAIQAWIDDMGENDQAAVMTFGSEIAVLSDFTSDKALLGEAVETLAPTDMETQLYNGIVKAVDLAKRQGGGLPAQRTVIVLSDAMDDFPSGATVEEVQNKAVETGIPLYAVGIRNGDNQTALNALGAAARASGGELFAAVAGDIDQSYESVRKNIKSGYVATVPLDAADADGGIHGMILTVAQGGVSAEDSADIRLKAFASSSPAAVETPQADAAGSPAPAATPGQEESGEWSRLFPAVWIALPLIVAAAVFLLLRRRKRGEAAAEFVDASMENATPAAHDGNRFDMTVRLDDDADKTVSLAPDGPRVLRLTLTETATGKRYAAPLKGQLRVGRKVEGNDIVIDDKAVSGRHCLFSLEQDALYIRDLDSSNGTFVYEGVKRRRVDSTRGATVKNGDTVSLGRTELEIGINFGETADGFAVGRPAWDQE
jgi:VWFA-related protein